MVATLLRLRLSTLLGGWYRQGSARLVPVCTILLVVLLIGSVFLGVWAVSGSQPVTAFPFLVTFGAALSFLMVVWPISGAGQLMEPEHVAVYPLSRPQLLGGLYLGALISIPALITVTAGFAEAGYLTGGASTGFATGFALAGFTLLCTLAAVLVVVSGTRVITLLMGLIEWGARARMLWRLLLGVLLLVAAVVAIWLITLNWRWGTGFRDFQATALALGWTPFGAGWSAPLLAAQDQWQGAWGQFAVLLGGGVLLSAAWLGLAQLSLSFSRQPVRASRRLGLGWFDVLPGNAFGVVAARSLTYWGRDQRYRVAFGAVPSVAVFAMLAFVVAGLPWPVAALLPLPIFAWMLGWLAHNDIASDHTAFWLHVSTGVSGFADRLGRLVPPLVYGLPVLIVGSLITGVLSASPWPGLALFGVSLCLLLAGLGISSVLSVARIYPTVQPSQSPFRQPQNITGDAVFAQASGLAAAVLVASPSIVLLFFGFEAVGEMRTVWLLAAAVSGLLLGTLVLYGGVLIGARLFEQSRPELLREVQRG